jgi:hypothetical protein
MIVSLLASATLLALDPAATAATAAPLQLTDTPAPTDATKPVEMTPVSPQAQIDERPAQAPRVASTGYPPLANGWGGKTGPKYYLSRWAEDWSYLRDETKRKDAFDRFKFIALNADKSIYLTLSNEERLRLNHTSNPGLRAGADTQDQLLLRIFTGADLHIGDHVRVYGELASSILGGRNVLPANANARNDLYVQQVYADAHAVVAGAEVGARYGRQDFLDGPPPIISNQENPSIHFTLTGTRLWVNGSRARVGLFDLSYNTLGANAFDDPVDRSQRLRGGIVSFVITPSSTDAKASKIFFDPFVFDGRQDSVQRGSGRGRERRQYYGARLWGTTGPVSFDWSLVKQSGRFYDRAIDAYQVFTTQTVQVGGGAWKPTLGFHADISSGGGTFGSGTMRSAGFLFGTVINYSYAPFFGMTNSRTLAPMVSVTPTKRLRIALEYEMIQRDSLSDAVYNGVGGFYAGTQNVRGRGVANLSRANIVYTINPHLSFVTRIEHVDAKSALTKAGFTDTFFIAPWLQFRF